MKVFRISGRDVGLVNVPVVVHACLNESLPHKRKRQRVGGHFSVWGTTASMKVFRISGRDPPVSDLSGWIKVEPQ